MSQSNSLHSSHSNRNTQHNCIQPSMTSLLLSENIIILKILSENYLKKIKPRVTYVTKCALQDMEKPSTLLLLKKSWGLFLGGREEPFFFFLRKRALLQEIQLPPRETELFEQSLANSCRYYIFPAKQHWSETTFKMHQLNRSGTESELENHFLLTVT